MISPDIGPIDEKEALQICETWKAPLNSRYLDLLQISGTYKRIPLFHYKVKFLHRTVRDFLRDSYYDKLQENAGTSFKAISSLRDITLALIKTLHAASGRQRLPHESMGLVYDIMYYCRKLDTQGDYGGPLVLDELDRVMDAQAKQFRIGYHWTNMSDQRGRNQQENGQKTFMALAVQRGITGYVSEKLAENPDLVHQRGRPLFDYAIHSEIGELRFQGDSSSERFGVDEKMVKVLLAHGASRGDDDSTNPLSQEITQPKQNRSSIFRRMLWWD